MRKYSWLRNLVVFAAGGGAGVLVGMWYAHRASGPRPAAAEAIKPRAVSAVALPATGPKLAAALPRSAAVGASGSVPLAQRLEVLRWLHQHQMEVVIPLFRMPGEFNPQLAEALGLTPAQTQRINAAFAAAQQALLASQRAAAKSALSPDNRSLTVSIAASTDGGAAYDSLVGVLKQTMDSDQYAAFNDLCGEGLDYAFDSFGAASQDFEISLDPNSSNSGAPHYRIVKKGAIGQSSYTNSGLLSADALLKAYPVLSGVVSADSLSTLAAH